MPVNARNGCGMNAVVRLDPRAYRRTPWKNGGGVTVDIADDYRAGRGAGQLERDAVAASGGRDIVAPAPFSDLAGSTAS